MSGRPLFPGGLSAALNSPVVLIAFLKLVFHLSVNAFAGYGYFRDEFYYIACSERLDWGYVDHPPVSIALLFASRAILGDSIIALRLVPALAGAATVLIAGFIARDLGGNRSAQTLTALAVFSAPILLAMNSVYSMNSLDFLVWCLSAWCLVRIVNTGDSRLWLLLGAVLGIGLMNKVGVLWLGAGILLGLLIAGRGWLRTPWPWYAAGIAAVLFIPFILWNMSHEYAHVEFIRNATLFKYSARTPWQFIGDQILLQNPATLPLWLGGLWYFLIAKPGQPFRIIGVTYLVAFLILIINPHSKAEYLSPAYPMMFAGGAVWFEKKFLAARVSWRRLLFSAVAVGGMLLAPLASPVLPVRSFLSYARALGVAPSTSENKEIGELPQFYADMFGWEELTATVVTVFRSLPDDEQRDCLIYAQNYGEAGAVSFLGREHNLPRVVSGHNNYFLWGPGQDSVGTVIIVGGDRDDHVQAFESVELVAQTRCRYCMPYENNLPIFVARKLRRKLEEVWPLTKNYS